MYRQILALAWKDLKIVLKDRGAVILLFVQPFMFIVVMSYALGGMYEPGEDAIRLLAVNEDRGNQAAAILAQLDAMDALQVETTWNGEPLSRAKAQELIVKGERSMALVFPPEFSEVLAQGLTQPQRRTATVELIVDPASSPRLVEPIMGTLQGLIERATYTAMVSPGLDFLFDTLAPQTPSGEREAFKAQAEKALSAGLVSGEEPLVTIERKVPTGMHVEVYPNAFQQNVPGYAIYGIFWIVSLLTGSVLQERRDGTFRRLLVSPMSRGALLLGKVLPCYVINLMQLALMLGAARVLFELDLGRSPAGLALVSLTAAAAATGLGVLVAALARTEAQAGGLTTFLLLTLSALGGCFVPRILMPEWLQRLGMITPHAWALDAYQDLLVRGYGLADVWPKAGALSLFALVFFSLGAWRFRFD